MPTIQRFKNSLTLFRDWKKFGSGRKGIPPTDLQASPPERGKGEEGGEDEEG
jgi:hypothetical protein